MAAPEISGDVADLGGEAHDGGGEEIRDKPEHLNYIVHHTVPGLVHYMVYSMVHYTVPCLVHYMVHYVVHYVVHYKVRTIVHYRVPVDGGMLEVDAGGAVGADDDLHLVVPTVGDRTHLQQQQRQ